MNVKRSFLVFLMFTVIAWTARSPATAADKVRIAVSNFNVTFLPVAVASKKGDFRDEGLEVEIIRVSAAVSVAALASGDLDYIMVLGSSVRAALRGLPIKVLASFIDALALALIAQPGIKSVAELRGKTLGISTFGSTSDLAARIMVRHYGVDPEKEMKILGVGPDAALLAALKEKLIDVAIASPPADVQAKKMGFNVLARAYDVFRYPAIGLSATDKKIKERPDEAKRILKALIRANRYMRDDRTGTIHVLMEWAKVDHESAAMAYDGSAAVFNANDGTIPEEGLRLVLEQAKKEARITRDIPLTEITNVTILRETQKQLNAKRD
ncbi:MAG: ABC transporter substrate-binding protein [Deltaproteobacteria bacterium]|nr:ABC transporter substrate-binding protein [Deltaproteobacteria bacterium]